MFVTRRLLIALVVLASAGVGATMYVVLLATTGMGQAAPAPAAAPAAVPVDVKVDLSDLPACIPAAAATDGSGGGSGSESSTESGDFATNSGVIDGSQFNDGGFGDLGQQWWNVTVAGDVTTVNVGDSSSATVTVGGVPATSTGSTAASGSTPDAAPTTPADGPTTPAAPDQG